MATGVVVGDKTGQATLSRATTHVGNAFTWSFNRMEPRRRDFVRRYAQYRGNMNLFGRDPIQSQLRSQIWIPKSGALVETVLPKTIGDNPSVEVRGRKPEFAPAAQNMGMLLDYYNHAMGFFGILYNWWKDSLIYGTGLTKAIWSFREGEKPVINPMLFVPPSQSLQTTSSGFVTATIEDMPRLVNVDIFDFLFDYTSSSIPRMDFVIERYELPIDEVVSRLEAGKYAGVTKEDLTAWAVGAKELTDDTYSKDERDRAAYSFYGAQGDTTRERVDQLKRVILYDYWGRFDINGDGKDENCLVTAIGPRAQRVVRAIRNPYIDGEKPYVAANYIPVPNDFLGIGLMEWCEQLQREINTRYNMSTDNSNYMLNQMLLVRRSAGIPDAQLKSRPSGRIDCDDPTSDVLPLPMAPIFDKLIAMQQWNDQLWQETTGVGSEFAGVRKSAGSAMHRTAGGILALQQAADARLKMSRLLFEKRVEKAVEMIISRIKQFMDAPITVDIIGPEGLKYLEIFPSQIQTAEYSLKLAIAPTEMIGKMAEREKWAAVLAVLRSFDPTMLLFEWGNILEDWMEATGLPNPQRYLGQMKQKIALLQQANIINSMMAPPGTPGPLPGPGGGGGGKQGGGGGGMQGSAAGQEEKKFGGQGAQGNSEQELTGGDRGRAGQR